MKRIKIEDLVMFSIQLANMLGAGMTLKNATMKIGGGAKGTVRLCNVVKVGSKYYLKNITKMAPVNPMLPENIK